MKQVLREIRKRDLEQRYLFPLDLLVLSGIEAHSGKIQKKKRSYNMEKLSDFSYV